MHNIILNKPGMNYILKFSIFLNFQGMVKSNTVTWSLAVLRLIKCLNLEILDGEFQFFIILFECYKYFDVLSSVCMILLFC